MTATLLAPLATGSSPNHCPALADWSASPLQASVGGVAIAVTAEAKDADDDRLSYFWSATAGRFDDAASRTTKYRCTTAGDQTLTITVRDGACEAKHALRVTCVAATAGR